LEKNLTQWKKPLLLDWPDDVKASARGGSAREVGKESASEVYYTNTMYNCHKLIVAFSLNCIKCQ